MHSVEELDKGGVWDLTGLELDFKGLRMIRIAIAHLDISTSVAGHSMASAPP